MKITVSVTFTAQYASEETSRKYKQPLGIIEIIDPSGTRVDFANTTEAAKKAVVGATLGSMYGDDAVVTTDSEPASEDDNRPYDTGDIIALMNRQVKRLQRHKDSVMRPDTEWVTLNAKQAELQYVLGRITAHKMGIRDISKAGD